MLMTGKSQVNFYAAFSILTISVAFLPVIVQARVVITEVAYDPLHADDTHEWIELFNDGAETIDLAKWSFSDGSSQTKHALNAPPKNGGTGSLSIAPGEYIVVADDATTFRAEYPQVAHVIDSTMNLPNPPVGASASIGLYDDKKQIADTFAYVGGTSQKNTGDSAQRAGSHVIGAAPTPGASNAIAPRLPVAAAAPAKKTAPAKPARPRVTGQDAGEVAGVSHVPPEAAPVPEIPAADMPPVRSQVAATGSVPPLSSPWLWGSVLLALCGGGVAAYAKSLEQDEWVIEDTSDTV